MLKHQEIVFDVLLPLKNIRSKCPGDVLRNLQNTSCKIFGIADFNQKSKRLDNFYNALLYWRLSMFDM